MDERDADGGRDLLYSITLLLLLLLLVLNYYYYFVKSAFALALRSIISIPAMLNPKSSKRSFARDRSNGFKPSKVARASRVAPSCWKCNRTIKLVIVQHSSTFSFRSSQYLR